MAERGARGRQGVAGTGLPRDAPGGAGIAPSGFAAWPSLVGRLREWIAAEAGAGRLLPWVPIAFGTGIAFYFTADHEPVLSVAAVTAIGFCVGAVPLRRPKLFRLGPIRRAMAD